MSEKMENLLRECQLVSMGKLLAGYTHGLKNHLAIINESSGLMVDLLEMAQAEDDPIHLRFRKIIATITERISLANEMANYLNSFAHRMDTPLSSFNVNDLLIEELALIDRLARLKKVQIKKNLQEDMPQVLNNPSLFQFIVFTLVHELVGKLAAGGVLEISSLTRGQVIHVHMDTTGQIDTAQVASEFREMEDVLQFAATRMGIDFVRVSPASGRFKVILTFQPV